MSRRIVLVDMDGPLADFDRLFFDRCEAEGWAMDCVFDERRHRFATDHLPNRAQRDLARSMVHQPGWFRDLPVTPGAVEGLGALAELADVWICTKPLELNPTCRDEKARWLVEHFGGDWERRLIVTPDKSMVRGDVLLDDAPYLEWLPVADWRCVIFTLPWNGPTSKWGHLPHWEWGNTPGALLDLGRVCW